MKANESGNSKHCSKQKSKRTYTKKRVCWMKKAKANAIDIVAEGNPELEIEPVIPEDNIDIVVEGNLIDFETEPVIAEDNILPGNSHDLEHQAANITVSSSKVIDVETETHEDEEEIITGYRIMDTEILNTVFHLLSCPDCSITNTIKLVDILPKKKGLASCLALECSNCNFTHQFYSSKNVDTGKSGMKMFDINVRTIYGMRAVGGGHSALEKFCGYANMPKPMTQNNYDKVSRQIMVATQNIAERSMKDAANDLKGDSDVDITNVPVSVDGTWQKRGFSSLNGVVTAISVDSGKILDSEIMSRKCKGLIRD